MTVAGLILLGLIAGALSASLGIGGGVVFVPALVLFFDVGQHLAQGTSLAVIVPTTLVGAWAHARAGRVVWRTAAAIGGAGIVGGILGALVALTVDEDLLQRLFAVLLVVTAVRMLKKTRTRRPSGGSAG